MPNILLEEIEYKIDQTSFGKWRRYGYIDGTSYHEFASHARILGLPLVHYTYGRNPETGRRKCAKGIIAVGRFACGVIAIGQASLGLIAIGQLAVGIILGLGQLTTGVRAVGQVALGLVFGLGQFATGYVAIGEFAYGKYVLAQLGSGKFIWTMQRTDWEGLEFTPIVDDEGKVRIRTLNFSDGLPELYRIYLKGVAASDVEHQIINLVKAIEYVSATVIRLASHDAMRQRLLSHKALAPDAKFLDDLIMLVEDQRIFKKDSEALRLTVNTCCDTNQLASHAPPVLKTLSSLSEASDAKTKKTALDELSRCLSSTRNQLVHAKANYTLTGNECPYEQLPILAGCVNLAATQVIRWFAGLPIESRVF